MKPVCYVLSADGLAKYAANIRPASHRDFIRTEQENWQTSWLSDFIQEPALEKYALEIADTDELVGLGAYRNMPEGVLVYVEYIESAPSSNPTFVTSERFLSAVMTRSCC